MSVEIKDIRAGLATNLQTLSDTFQVSNYPKDNPTPPAFIIVGFDQIVRAGFGNRSFTIPFVIRGLAGMPTQESAYVRLDQWLSPIGAINVWTAIESDKSLGGKVQDVTVQRCDGVQTITLTGGVEVLGSTWHVQILL